LQQQLVALPKVLGKAEESETSAGKMFGVLVVQNDLHQFGFLSTYSGQLEGDSTYINFVPAVSNMQLQDAAFLA
jgi:tRNA pseudouridine32 synthase/23S rRNA pseudouridine746 synthase